MKGDPVSFRIYYERAKTVFADLLPLTQNFSAILASRVDRLLQTPFDQQIN